MSKLKRTIELYPDFAIRKEMIVSPGHKCPACLGKGERLMPDDSKDMAHWEKCDFCNGTGEVDAIANIEWRAHKE